MQRGLAQSASWNHLPQTLARSDHDPPQRTVVKKLGEAERLLRSR
jgi:hypothetical protein